MQLNKQAGFSLLEVLIAGALVSITAGVCMIVLLQGLNASGHRQRAAAVMTTTQNVAADVSAVLRYADPLGVTVRNNGLPETFAVTEWEPDMPDAPVQCRSAHNQIDPDTQRLSITCTTRNGEHAQAQIEIGDPVPVPASRVTPTPDGSLPGAG